jgi:F-type H+-transporting ATPase subunit a
MRIPRGDPPPISHVMISDFALDLPLAAVDKKAVAVWESLPTLTNSVIVSLVTFGVLFLFTRLATAHMKKVPTGAQNFFEMIFEKLYAFVEGILGPKVAPKAFPLLSTFFFFWLISNWLGLMPGVGTIGQGVVENGHFHVTKPLLRPSAADLNAGLAISMTFMVVWLWISIKEVGVGGFLSHLFAPKGKSKSPIMQVFLIIVFFGVGLLEIVSISIRPFSLSLRIFGNIFAGENLLHEMAALGNSLGAPDAVAFVMRCVVPVPFMFLELLVGFLQAVVFTLLCTVYIQLSTAHDDHGHGEHKDGHH